MPRRDLGIEPVGAGSGGAEEMAKYMHGTEVLWAVVVVQTGAGLTRRDRFVFVHFSGPDVPAVRRGKANGMTTQVQNLVRSWEGAPFTATVNINRLDEVTTPYILEEISKSIVIDTIEQTEAKSQLRAHKNKAKQMIIDLENEKLEEARRASAYQAIKDRKAKKEAEEFARREAARKEEEERMKEEEERLRREEEKELEEARRLAAEAEAEAKRIEEAAKLAAKEEERKKKEEGQRLRVDGAALQKKEQEKQQEAAEMMKKRKKSILMNMAANNALETVGEHDGALNWVLVNSDLAMLPVIGSGTDGVEGMRECATKHQDKVMYGLLRVNYGVGPMSRLKVCMVHLIGDAVKAVNRGRRNALRPGFEKKFKEFANIACIINVVMIQDLTAEFIDEELSSAVIDDSDVAKDGGERILDEAKNKAKLADQDHKRKEMYGDMGPELTGGKEPRGKRNDKIAMFDKIVEQQRHAAMGPERPAAGGAPKKWEKRVKEKVAFEEEQKEEPAKEKEEEKAEEIPAGLEQPAAEGDLGWQIQIDDDDVMTMMATMEIEDVAQEVDESNPPNWDKSMQDMLDMLYVQKSVNWALFAAK